MASALSVPRIELQAAKTAIEWTNLFAQELDAAARGAAKESGLVTSDHYRQALPIATSRVLAAINSQNVEDHDVNSRAA